MSTEPTNGAQAPLDLTTISREEWLAQRGLGSSDSSAICGLNPWRTPYKVWAEKVGIVAPFAGNEATEIGLAMEPVISELYAKRTGRKIRPIGKMYQHKLHPFITATPDREIDLGNLYGRLGELKNVGWRMVHEWDDNNTPDNAHIQVQHQLMVCPSFEDADVIALLGGRELAIRHIEHDLKVQARLLEILCQFQELIDTKTPPPLVAEDAETIKKLFPESQPGIEIILPEEAEFLLEQRAKAEEALKVAKSQKDEAETKLKALLGNAERGKGKKFMVSWKTQNRAGYTVEPTSFRQFTVKKEK